MTTHIASVASPATPDASATREEPADAVVRAPAAYMNPYLAGVGLGLVLLAAYVLMGRGLGASGASSSLVAWTMNVVAPGHAQANEFYRGYLDGGVGHPLKEWLVFEVLGVMLGGFMSGVLAGRARGIVEKGPNISNAGRFGLAFGGGALMGIGAKLARGCTSGQALSGGAVLNAGSWAFMLMVFAGAYAMAWAVRRQWR
jgi:uncharacterized membrane protein YedE/YeeE